MHFIVVLAVYFASRTSIVQHIGGLQAGNLEGLKILLDVGMSVDVRRGAPWPCTSADPSVSDLSHLPEFIAADFPSQSVRSIIVGRECTPLHVAAAFGRKDVVVGLLNHKPAANIEALTLEGYTPLALAVLSGHVEVVRLLIYRRASLSYVAQHGESIVHHALASGSRQMVELLVAADAFSMDDLKVRVQNVVLCTNARGLYDLLGWRGWFKLVCKRIGQLSRYCVSSKSACRKWTLQRMVEV
jgi:hypothetical protein